MKPDFYLDKILPGLNISTLFKTPIERFEYKRVAMVSGFMEGILVLLSIGSVFVAIY
jgi:hypothetical protein